MGFFAFAAGTVLLSAVEMKWVPPSDAAMVSVILLSYVAPLELVASIFGFLSRDSGAATSMGILGTGWIAVALCFLLKGAHAQIPALGIFLLMEAAAMFVIGSVSLPAKPLLTVVLFLAGARFILSALVHLGAAKILTIPAAILGLIIGALAIYGALALLLEDIRQHSVLPVFRRGPAKESLEGGLQDQLKRLDHEAGFASSSSERLANDPACRDGDSKAFLKSFAEAMQRASGYRPAPRRPFSSNAPVPSSRTRSLPEQAKTMPPKLRGRDLKH